MSVSSPSSSVQQARRALADRLRELREDAGLTGRELARRCGWHESKRSRIEAAKTAPSQADIKAWCKACGADDQADELIATLRAVKGMFVEWRRLHRDGLRRQQERRRPLYERTRHFRAYSSWLVPGLVQTRGYTTAVLRRLQEQGHLPDDVEEAVEARMQRQGVLHSGHHRFALVVEETVLRNAVCDAETMVGQLGHLITVASLPSVSLGVIPMGVGRTRWPAEGFWIFDEEQVNVELITGYLTITQPQEVAGYERAFAELASLAVYGSAARSLITTAIDALA
jgi:transcriptional regulator with XRE-family HTH domain